MALIIVIIGFVAVICVFKSWNKQIPTAITQDKDLREDMLIEEEDLRPI